MSINTYVELKTFLGTTQSNESETEQENYWKLIGERGKIIIEEKNKVLMLFNRNLDELNLVNHNPQKNNLWINKSDLELD